MEKRTGPYVGVTGFTELAQIQEALKTIPKHAGRRLMVGVLMSATTLDGRQNKWQNRYPRKECVSRLFISDDRLLNLVHYSSDSSNFLYRELEEITTLAGPHFHGFQLNINWPVPEEIARYRAAHPEKFLVLQLGSQAIAQYPAACDLARRMTPYSRTIDAFTLDASKEVVKEFPSSPLFSHIKEIVQRHPMLAPGVGGWPGPRTLHLLDAMLKDFHNISISAGKQLRNPNNDTLNIASMTDYLSDAFGKLAGQELPGIRLSKPPQPYGFDEHAAQYGSGVCALRTARLAQPLVLQKGDILATGEKVLSPPRLGGNGTVFIQLSGGTKSHWVALPARIPVALLTDSDNAPAQLWDKHKNND